MHHPCQVPEPLMNPREPTPLVPHKGEHTLALGHYGIGNRLGDALAMGLNCGDLRKLHHVSLRVLVLVLVSLCFPVPVCWWWLYL